MTKAMIPPLLFGLVGCAILVALGLWQVERLAWKEGELAEIATRIAAAPVPLPAAPAPERDRYLPVAAEGLLTGEEIRVLASVKRVGAVHRLVSVLDVAGRRVLVDRGYVAADIEPDLAHGPFAVTGNLHWPDEVDRFTPAPDTAAGLWFARDVDGIAAHLGTEPVMVVAREVSGFSPPATPLPVDTAHIPNDHLEYAITWFSLAAVWLGMTGFLLWRIRARTA